MTFSELIQHADNHLGVAYHRVDEPTEWFIWFDLDNAEQLCMGPKTRGRVRVNQPDSYDVPVAIFLHDLRADSWEVYQEGSLA